MRPKVSIVSGVSLDGKISTGRGVSSKDVMPLPLSVRKFLHSLRAKFDGIMVGCNTVKIDNPFLTVKYVNGKNPVRIVPCNRIDFDQSLNIFSKPGKVIIITTDKDKANLIKKEEIEVIILEEENICTLKMMQILWSKGIKTVMVEGGSKLNWSLLSNRLVDELILIHHPIVVGGNCVPTLAEGEPKEKHIKFNLLRTQIIDNYLITFWKPEY